MTKYFYADAKYHPPECGFLSTACKNENKPFVPTSATNPAQSCNFFFIGRCVNFLYNWICLITHKLTDNAPARMALAVKNTKLMGTTSVASNTFIASLRNLWREEKNRHLEVL